MSFNQTAKAEIIDNLRLDNKEMRALLSALIRTGNISIAGGKLNCEVTTDSAEVAKLYISMLRSIRFDAELNMHYEDGKVMTYRMVTENAGQLLNDMNIIEIKDGQVINYVQGAPTDMNEKETCAYLMGIFLGAGSVFVDDKDTFTKKTAGYHFEINIVSDILCREIITMFKGFDITAKLTERRNTGVVYIKENQAIADALALFGATSAMLSLSNVVAVRSAKNAENRATNCTVANMKKTINASLRQAEAIEKLKNREGGLLSLPSDLSEIAGLRLKNPDASLDELAGLLNGKLSKSGIRHRLNRIVELADGD